MQRQRYSVAYSKGHTPPMFYFLFPRGTSYESGHRKNFRGQLAPNHALLSPNTLDKNLRFPFCKKKIAQRSYNKNSEIETTPGALGQAL